MNLVSVQFVVFNYLISDNGWQKLSNRWCTFDQYVADSLRLDQTDKFIKVAWRVVIFLAEIYWYDSGLRETGWNLKARLVQHFEFKLIKYEICIVWSCFFLTYIQFSSIQFYLYSVSLSFIQFSFSQSKITELQFMLLQNTLKKLHHNHSKS